MRVEGPPCQEEISATVESEIEIQQNRPVGEELVNRKQLKGPTVLKAAQQGVPPGEAARPKGLLFQVTGLGPDPLT